jgi:rhamnosyl/mannosyltransferase
VVTYHSDIYKQRLLKIFYGPVLHAFLNRVDCIAATSGNYLDTSADLARHRGRCRVIPIGLDEASYARTTPENEAAWQERLGKDYFLFIGILRYYKGLDVLLQAARGAAYQVVIAGTGPLAEKLRNKAVELGLDNVRFVGYVADQDKSVLLRLARALVLPSLFRSEAFGVSLLEGAMFGLPLVSTDLGTGTSYVNQAGETGLVVPPGDVQALRRAMDRLYHNPELCEAMGKAARSRFESMFTADRMGEHYYRLYRELVPAQMERKP